MYFCQKNLIFEDYVADDDKVETEELILKDDVTNSLIKPDQDISISSSTKIDEVQKHLPH